MSGLDLAGLAARLQALADQAGAAAEASVREAAEQAAALAALARLHHLELRETAFLGDDLNDLPALTRAGLAACPADAVPEVRERCQFVSAHKGGDGAAREFLEFLWKAKGQWDTIVQEYVEMGRGDRQ